MSGVFTTDRRQSPRIALDGGLECRLDLRTRVRLVDISLGGALLAAELPLPTGASAQLRSGLGAGAFQSDVQVKRAVALPAGLTLNGLGATFTSMDERSRRSLEEFLRKASQ
jgi:c-di-GMP-binding flagellar brake protein YcgR